jgi:hypothetical protein
MDSRFNAFDLKSGIWNFKWTLAENVGSFTADNQLEQKYVWGSPI